MRTIYIADAGPSEVVVYADRGGESREQARFDRGSLTPDEALDGNGWYRLRAWRAPHDAPGHLVAQVTHWERLNR